MSDGPPVLNIDFRMHWWPEGENREPEIKLELTACTPSEARESIAAALLVPFPAPVPEDDLPF